MTAWDSLSKLFDTHKADGDIHPSVADNVLLAWPAVLSGLSKVFVGNRSLRVLDYGCGAGGFCLKLNQLGHEVVGCDTSRGMTAVARKHLPKSIAIHNANTKQIRKLEKRKFDAITSIMVFQFIDDISSSIADLAEMLESGGALSFAVFNPDYVIKNCTKAGGFEAGARNVSSHLMALGDGPSIPLHLRTEQEYGSIVRAHGFTLVGKRAQRPRFTRDFLQSYPQDGANTSSSEYLVMTFRKTGKRRT
jgi:2-polyprenyl-3-methyl-5-hydroxy-6-metoxy-1,4-benzoquinol methylase